MLVYLLSTNSLLWTIASNFDGSMGKFRSKLVAYSIIAGNIISNPIGECSSSSVAEAKFDSTKYRPETRDIMCSYSIWMENITRRREDIPLLICSRPTFQRFSARTLAKVDKIASLMNKGSRWERPHDPSQSWLSSNQFKHSGKKGFCEEFREGTIATQAVSYEETESSTLWNSFLILSLVPPKLCKN